VTAVPARTTIGETLLVAVCALQPGRTAQLLPAPLRPAGDLAFVYLVWATVEGAGATVRARSFVEGNIALPCVGPEGEGTWFLRAYFPRADLVRNAVLSGWTGIEAEVAVGRVPAGVQRLCWPPAHPLGGWVAREGRREIEMSLLPGEAVALESTPLRRFNRVYGVREVAGVRDVTLEHHLDDVMHAVHAGRAELRVSGDAAAALGPHRVVAGYLIEFGIVYAGSRRVGGADG
jgi:hypothetical protein